jgi:hypothetical protein
MGFASKQDAARVMAELDERKVFRMPAPRIRVQNWAMAP